MLAQPTHRSPSKQAKMLSATLQALLLTFLVAAAVGPLGAAGSVQHSWNPLDKRRAPLNDGSECYHTFATDPKSCPMVRVAFFEDTECSKPLPLVKTVQRALINGNEQMLFDGAVAHSLKRPFGSIRVLAAVRDIGIGFAKHEESDTVVQNMAWMSAADTYKAYQQKSCVTLPNLDVEHVGVWSVRFEHLLNQGGYVWNPYNIPIKQNVPQCHGPEKRALMHGAATRSSSPVCLQPASYGGGAVLLLYKSKDCTVDPNDSKSVKMQLYSTVQCTPLTMTDFNSYRAVQPKGDTIEPIFSPAYYERGSTFYHSCAPHDVAAMPFKPNGECQRFSGNDMFVAVFGNDPNYPQPAPGPHDKVLLKPRGHLLLAPNPASPGPPQ